MQTFKSISFSDKRSQKSKIVPISFTEREQDLYTSMNKLSSQEIRSIIGYSDYSDLCIAAERDKRNVSQFIKFLLDRAIKDSNGIIAASDVTFKNSKVIPFNRWYPYIEGYSPDFVKSLIKKYSIKQGIIYDPFAGTGTTLFAADAMGNSTYYSEINPLLQFLIKTKLEVLKLAHNEWRIIGNDLMLLKTKLLKFNHKENTILDRNYKNVFKNSIYFPDYNYKEILQAKSFLESEDNSLSKNILTIAILSCLIPSSYLKKQGDLRFKTKKELEKKIPRFSELLCAKVDDIYSDLTNGNTTVSQVRHNHTLIHANAKCINEVSCDKISYVITSPPYLNGTNYIRNTKLELWFLGHLRTESDLRSFRDQILTSGINDVKVSNLLQIDIESKSLLLSQTMVSLKETAYDVRIPQMAECYFAEMFQIFSGLLPKLASGARLLIDIGDSVFNGVHIQTDDILIEILQNIGYKFVEKTKLRERRSRGGQTVTQVLIVMEN